MTEPIFRNPRVIIFGEIVVDEGSKCVFTPWMSREHNVFGWDASPADIEGKHYIYVAPDTSSEGEPQFFLYVGPYGDPKKDRRLGPYVLKEK